MFYLLPTSFQPSSFFPFLGLEVGVLMVATTVVPRGESVTVGVELPTVGDETCLDNLELELRTFPEEPDFVTPPTPPPPPPPPPLPPPPPSGTLISFEFFRLTSRNCYIISNNKV